MEDDQHFTLYNKPERKRELVVQLEAMLVEYRKASDTLDSKAWEILKVASATFGVVSALEITLSTGTLQLQFWLALLFALLVYSWLIFEVLCVISPQEWRLVPGTEQGVLSYEDLVIKYVPIDDNKYLDKLIVDYAGKKDPDNPNKLLSGAIQHTESLNSYKGKHIKRAAVSLAILIALLIAMAFFSTT
jgi:hypothetical protein